MMRPPSPPNALPPDCTKKMAIEILRPTSDSDVILVSRLQNESTHPLEFPAHKCILAAASPFFQDLFSLPQSTPSSGKERPRIPMTEPPHVIDALLHFIYPTQNPEFIDLDSLVPVLEAAVKYDLISIVNTLGKLLLLFARDEPLRVYAIASRFEMDEEERAAAKYTLSVNLLDAPVPDDFKHISAYSYARLLSFHHRCATAAIDLLKAFPDEILCMQCNGSGRGSSPFAVAFSDSQPPKWWVEFEARARKELSMRPTTDVVFEMDFLAQAVMNSGCTRCAGSVLDSWRYLKDLKRRIDELPIEF